MSNEYSTPRLPVRPLGQSTLSTILNGAGNGGMIVGFAAYVANHAHEYFRKAPFLKKEGAALTMFVGAGALVGAVHGFYEARDIHKFRETVADHINAMDREAAIDHTKLHDLYAQVQAHAGAHEKTR